MIPPATKCQIARRAFLLGGTLCLSPSAVMGSVLREEKHEPGLKVGLITDLHYADKPAAGSRHYRDTEDKLAEAGQKLAAEKPNFIVELGDFIDAADAIKTELSWLKRINKSYSAICRQRHYVLGNHCVHTLTKQEFLGGVERRKSYYSFDAGGFHFVVLDSCFRSDGVPYGRKNFKWTDPNIPAAELDWLKADLKATTKKTIVFAHQRLDVKNSHGVKNAASVRKVLEASGKVMAVFQGHSHKNDYKDISGIHYCTLVAMVEGQGPANNGYSVLTMAGDGAIRLTGFRKQKGYEWAR